MKVRIVQNKHASAKEALDKWLAGSLWGNPIELGAEKFHVYGCTRSHGRLQNRKWRTVAVEFTKNQIVVMPVGRESDVTAKRITADRQQFMDCVNGNLMTRNSNGEVTQLGDAASHAVEAAERGETVWLTANGVVVSKIVNGIEVTA